MQEYYPLEVWIMDYQKVMMDHIEEYNHIEEYRESVQKEAERLRSIYYEITSKAVFSKRFKDRRQYENQIWHWQNSKTR